eukprot:5045518-Pyramimonas_sp.AAC.1
MTTTGQTCVQPRHLVIPHGSHQDSSGGVPPCDPRGARPQARGPKTAAKSPTRLGRPLPRPRPPPEIAQHKPDMARMRRTSVPRWPKIASDQLEAPQARKGEEGGKECARRGVDEGRGGDGGEGWTGEGEEGVGGGEMRR